LSSKGACTDFLMCRLVFNPFLDIYPCCHVWSGSSLFAVWSEVTLWIEKRPVQILISRYECAGWSLSTLFAHTINAYIWRKGLAMELSWTADNLRQFVCPGSMHSREITCHITTLLPLVTDFVVAVFHGDILSFQGMIYDVMW
jgi:hypothetical protein